MNKNKPVLTLIALSSVASAVLPLTALAEDKVIIQAQTYSENEQRIKIKDGKVIFEHDFGADHTLNLEYNWDSVTGASPTWDSTTGASSTVESDAVSGPSQCVDEDCKYYQLCRDTRKIDGIVGDGHKDLNELVYRNVALEDFRNSLSALYTFRTPNARDELNLGLSYSKEDDFINSGVSAEYLWNTDSTKNRSITFGASYMKNEVYDYLDKKWNNFDLSNMQIGITQVFNPTLVAKFSLYTMLEKGHLSNPYFNVIRKLNVAQADQPLYFKYYIARDSRPDTRKAGGVAMQASKSFNHDNAAQVSYRYYQDSWGVNSHTADIKSYHHLGDKFRINPALRYYHQSAANFFKAHDAKDYIFDQTGFAPADHRLGAYHSWTTQLGLEYLASQATTWNILLGRQTQSSGLTMKWLHFGVQYKY